MTAVPRHRREYEFRIAQSDVLRARLPSSPRQISPNISEFAQLAPGPPSISDPFADSTSAESEVSHISTEASTRWPYSVIQSTQTAKSQKLSADEIMLRLETEEEIKRDWAEKQAAWKAELETLSSNPPIDVAQVASHVASIFSGSRDSPLHSVQNAEPDYQHRTTQQEAEEARENYKNGVEHQLPAMNLNVNTPQPQVTAYESNTTFEKSGTPSTQNEASSNEESNIESDASGKSADNVGRGFSVLSHNSSLTDAKSTSAPPNAPGSSRENPASHFTARAAEAISGRLSVAPDVPDRSGKTETADKALKTPSEDLVQLVETGNVKSLTVTKLRRLLTAHDLKTNGRKAELIARLVSFVKSSS